MTYLICVDNTIVARHEESGDALADLHDLPGAVLAEEIILHPDGSLPIPGELDRAIDEWNAMTDRVNIHIDKVKNRARLVKPYRRWKKELGKRDYFLEQLIPDVEAQPFLWTTIRFPWLLRVSADFNSDKVHARAYGKAGNGKANGKMTEADFLRLAGRVSLWKREHDHLYVTGHGTDADERYNSYFESELGVSPQKFDQLRAQFNGVSHA